MTDQLRSPDLPFSVLHHGPLTVLTAVGDVDVAVAARFRAAINDLVVDGRVRLVIDLSDVTFMDSSGLGVLVAAHRKVRPFKGVLGVVVDRDPVVRLLSITALDRVLRCYPSLDAALADLA